MLETLILNSLFEKKCTIYGIKKYITDKFGIFSIPSLGAIHPAIQRLEKKGYVSVAKTISDGGKKALYHQITSEGKKYFNVLFSEIQSTTVDKISSEIKIKIIILQNVKDKETKKAFFENTQRALELASYEIKNFIANNKNGYIETSASLLLKEFSDLKYNLDILQKEELV